MHFLEFTAGVFIVVTCAIVLGILAFLAIDIVHDLLTRSRR